MNKIPTVLRVLAGFIADLLKKFQNISLEFQYSCQIEKEFISKLYGVVFFCLLKISL